MQIKYKTMLSVGLLSLVLSILIGKFTSLAYGSVMVSDFLSGFFVGLSVVMMLAYVVRLRTKTVPLDSAL
jgi:hypothetical protein